MGLQRHWDRLWSPLALNGFGWQGALFMLMCFPLLALFMAATVAKPITCKFEYLARLVTRGIWRSPLAPAGHTLFLGINSLVYYVRLLAGFGDPHQSRLYEAQAGSLHGLLQLATAARFADPSFLTSCEDQRGIAAFVALMCAVGAVGLCFMPAHAITDSAFGLVRRNNDTGVDVHWSSGKFCASGGGTFSGMAQSVGICWPVGRR